MRRLILAGLLASVFSCPALAQTGPINPSASTAAESCHTFQNGPAVFVTGSGYIGAAGWIMLLDSASIPADGAVTPVAWTYVSAAGSWFIDYGQHPARMKNGIVLCASSTGPLTKTAYSTNTVFTAQVQ